MMDIDVVKFINELTILQMVVFVIVIELIEVLFGILRAWKEGKPIQSAITRESLYEKFSQWVFPFAIILGAIWVKQDEIAKMILIFILIPELTSIIENIIRTFTKSAADKSLNDEK